MMGFYEKLELEQQNSHKQEDALVWSGDPWLREFLKDDIREGGV